MRRKTVVIVDDDDAIREFVEWALADEGYQVLGAADGVAALAIVGRLLPDLILLDLRMPGMDGATFARAYRKLPAPRAPIVVISAARDGRGPGPDVEAAGYLDKPFDLLDLLYVVEHHTSAHPLASHAD